MKLWACIKAVIPSKPVAGYFCDILNYIIAINVLNSQIRIISLMEVFRNRLEADEPPSPHSLQEVVFFISHYSRVTML